MDGAPFVVHPFEVAALLDSYGFDEPLIIAGVLHDVVEKTDATLDQLSRRFGPQVGRIVAALTEDERIDDFTERKAALREQVARAAPDAHAVYAADKIAKVRELRVLTARRPDRASRPRNAHRLAHYRESLEMLRDVGAAPPLVTGLAFELWALDAFAPDGED